MTLERKYKNSPRHIAEGWRQSRPTRRAWSPGIGRSKPANIRSHQKV